jgi:hypothetical protein
MALRMPPETREAVEAWAKRQDDTPTLSVAVRRLIERGLHDKSAVSGQRIQLGWEMDDPDQSFLSANMEPYELHVDQDGGTFIWHIHHEDDDADKDAVAEGDAPSLVAAMAAAEAAAFEILKTGSARKAR